MRRQSLPGAPVHPLYPIGIHTADAGLKNESETLAAQTSLPIVDTITQLETALVLSRNGLALTRPNEAEMTGVVQVDFTKNDWIRRIKRVREERLVKAMGKKTSKNSRIIDATGGLGRDGFLLAAAGFQVRIIERNQILAALLADGLNRASEAATTREICRRVRLTSGDAIDFLGTGEAVAEILYLDPMFPKTTSTAKVKKELQMIRHVTTEDRDIDELFARALRAAGERVVVKRPRKGPWLSDLRPSYALDGKTVRFDIYLSHDVHA